jgi:hypothetical protein
MKLTLQVLAQSSLIWRLKTFFNSFCNKANRIRTMMDEVMANKCTSPLLLQAMFFTMQNIGILSLKNSTKSWNSA